MSLKYQSTFAPQPVTTRASPTQISVDPKGERIAYTSGKSVFLRSIDNPSICTQYIGHTAAVNVARFSPSGYYVASGDASGKVRVWDCVGEEMILKGEFPIISGPIKDLAWDGESKRIIAVGEGKGRFGHCITFDTGNSVGEVTGQSAVINSVSIRQQRPFRAATASDDHTIVFYHGAPFKFNQLIKGRHSNFVHSVAFSPDGSYFVSVGADRNIFLFDGKEGTFLGEVKGEDGSQHKGSIMAVSWCSDSTRFVTASADQTVKVWDAKTQKLFKTWRLGPAVGGSASSIPHQQVGVVWAPQPNGVIISLSLSGDLNYFSEASDEPIKIIPGHQKSITALQVASQKELFTGATDGRICRWDISTGLPSVVQGEGHSNFIVGFAQSSSGSVSSAAWDDKIRNIDVATKTFDSSYVSAEAQPKGISALSSGKVAVLTEFELRVYSAPPLNLIASEKLSFIATSIAASPAGTDIAVAGQDKIVRVFSLSSSVLSSKATLSSNRSFGTAMAYSPDGLHLAVGDSSGLIILYATGDYSVKTNRWAFHTARIGDIAWNSFGTHIVSGSLDTNLFVYSVANPMKNFKATNAHMGGINAVGWECDGVVVSAGSDGTVKRWQVALAE